MHSFSLPFRMKQSGPSAESICTSGALDMYGIVQMLAGQMRQNMVTVLDVAMPAPSLSGMLSFPATFILLKSFQLPQHLMLETLLSPVNQAQQSLLRSLQPLTPDVAEDVEDLHAVETMNIHGAVTSGI